MSPRYRLLMVQLLAVTMVGSHKTDGSQGVALRHTIWEVKVPGLVFAGDKGAQESLPINQCPLQGAPWCELFNGVEHLLGANAIKCLAKVPKETRVAASKSPRPCHHGANPNERVPGGSMWK